MWGTACRDLYHKFSSVSAIRNRALPRAEIGPTARSDPPNRKPGGGADAIAAMVPASDSNQMGDVQAMADPKSDSKFDSKSDLTADPDAAVAPRAAAPASRSSAPGRLARLRRAGEPVLRRVLHLWWRLSRGLTLGVRALVIDPEGRVFLVRHSYVSGWYLPGGGVEIGETLGEALVRELSEEGNLHLTGAATLHGVYLNARVSRRDHVALFVVRDFVQPAPPRPNREIVAAGFFPVDALPADTTRGTRARLAEVLGGAPVTEHW